SSMAHIFISYSKKNRAYARQLADKLLELGFDVWIDDRIDYGDDWWQTIFHAIREAKAFVVIMTDEANASKWVQREVTLADQHNIPAFPVWLNGDFHNSANWSIYVRTQYADVRGGHLLRELTFLHEQYQQT
ncbi:MAG TPA: toll/interleukin-1 receptor domain-containing protein, partial [Phototrophicaceae bacterium]|nr:toll/interleukin-1 receptor domain-containing protein [Phototrophicaceae bacterium]